MNRRKKVNQILKKRAKKQTINQQPKQKSGYISKADRENSISRKNNSSKDAIN